MFASSSCGFASSNGMLGNMIVSVWSDLHTQHSNSQQEGAENEWRVGRFGWTLILTVVEEDEAHGHTHI